MISIISEAIVLLVIVFGSVGTLAILFKDGDEFKRWSKIMGAFTMAGAILAILFVLSVILISISNS